MARPYRLQTEDCCYHITSRGDGRKAIYQNERDYEKFLSYISKAKERYRFYVYAYALMTNHYHLLIETQEANLSRIMQYINTSYTTYHNIKYKKSGHLFQGRYKSIVVDRDTYLLTLSRYIHLNPVRAKMVKDPGEYRWTSYREYIEPKLRGYTDKERIKELGIKIGKAYEEFVRGGYREEGSPLRNAYAGFILGSKEFIKDTLEEISEQKDTNKEVSYKRQIFPNIDVTRIIGVVLEHYGVSKKELLEGRRRREMKEKKMAIYLLRRFTGLNNRGIGELFGMKYAAVSKAGTTIEQLIEKDNEVKKEVARIISNFEV